MALAVSEKQRGIHFYGCIRLLIFISFTVDLKSGVQKNCMFVCDIDGKVR